MSNMNQSPSLHIAIQFIHCGVVLQSHGTGSVHGSMRSSGVNCKLSLLPALFHDLPKPSTHPMNCTSESASLFSAATIALRPPRVRHSPIVIFTSHPLPPTKRCGFPKTAFLSESPSVFAPRRRPSSSRKQSPALQPLPQFLQLVQIP